MGIDPNNAIYPIAYAVVESECYETWSWFFEFLKEDLGIASNNHITWISDRQKSLIEAVKTVFGDAPYLFCVRYQLQNPTQGATFKQLLQNATRATIVPR